MVGKFFDRAVEKQARRHLRRAFFYRLMVELWDLPFALLIFIGHGLIAFGQAAQRVSYCWLYLEQDAARQYRDITGTDLGLASGTPSRYMGNRTGAFDSVVQAIEDAHDDAGG